MKQYNESFPGIDILLLVGTIVMADTYIANHAGNMGTHEFLTIFSLQAAIKMAILGFLVFEYLRLGTKEYLIALPLVAYMFCLSPLLGHT